MGFSDDRSNRTDVKGGTIYIGALAPRENPWPETALDLREHALMMDNGGQPLERMSSAATVMLTRLRYALDCACWPFPKIPVTNPAESAYLNVP